MRSTRICPPNENPFIFSWMLMKTEPNPVYVAAQAWPLTTEPSMDHHLKITVDAADAALKHNNITVSDDFKTTLQSYAIEIHPRTDADIAAAKTHWERWFAS